MERRNVNTAIRNFELFRNARKCAGAQNKTSQNQELCERERGEKVGQICERRAVNSAGRESNDINFETNTNADVCTVRYSMPWTT